MRLILIHTFVLVLFFWPSMGWGITIPKDNVTVVSAKIEREKSQEEMPTPCELEKPLSIETENFLFVTEQNYTKPLQRLHRNIFYPWKIADCPHQYCPEILPRPPR